MPEGTSLYVRHITKKRHGTPKQFAKKCKRYGLSWIALAGLWQDVRKDGRAYSKMINSIDTIARYGQALEDVGIDVYAWGYPWQGREEAFVERMMNSLAWTPTKRVLLDPELGANPTRSRSGSGKTKANEHAELLVKLFHEHPECLDALGLSTFGSGYRLKWFPLIAYTRALVERFGGRTFIGGQTYTVGEDAVDASIADMVKCIQQVGGDVQRADEVLVNGCQVVPNFGTYSRYTSGPKKGDVRRKTGDELRLHLYGFVNEAEPVDGMIGWAENFMYEATWDALHEFSGLLARGACDL